VPTKVPVPETTVVPTPVPRAETTAAGHVEQPAAVLEILHFDTDKWRIRDADAEILRKDAAYLKEHPELSVTITGYCDPRGTDAYNMILGLKRADAVRMFLADAGVDARRLKVGSEGRKRPISTNPGEYWLDRRVEFEITR
jgi:outer membrane protein OmpA-like peptidoglycan-associated protein